MLRYSNKIESVVLTKCSRYHCLTKKPSHNNKHFSELASHLGWLMLWRNYWTELRFIATWWSKDRTAQCRKGRGGKRGEGGAAQTKIDHYTTAVRGHPL